MSIGDTYTSLKPSINHRGLCASLAAPMMSLVGWIQSFLANRTFQVRIDDVIYEEADIHSVVPRCSESGLLLFAAMVSDLTRDRQQFCLTFADDTKMRDKSDDVPSI